MIRKLLFVSRALPFHSLGGMEIVSWDLARAVAQQGVEVIFLTTAVPGRERIFAQDGVTVHTVEAPPGRYSAEWWAQSQRLFRAEYDKRVDGILSVSAGALAIANARSGSSPTLLWQAHGTAWGGFRSHIREMRPKALVKAVIDLRHVAQDRAYRRFDGIVAVGDTVLRDLDRQPTRFMRGRTSIFLVPNGIAPERFRYDASARQNIRARYGLDGRRIVLSVSRLHRQKGIAEGLAGFAFARRTDPTLHYVIVGGGPEEQALRARADDLGVSNHVLFTGVVPRGGLNEWLSAADLFMLTSTGVEGFPTTMLEALAAGLPLVISRHLANERVPAALVDPDVPESVAGEILSNTNKTGSRASRLPKQLELDQCAASYIELFSSFLGKPS